MKTTPLFWFSYWFAVVALGVFAPALTLQSCGPSARGSGANATSFPGPNGTTCYVVYDSGRAVGGNCQ